MARTSITTARYNPFTMEELYSPILRYKEEYNKQQEKYDELANQAAAWNYRLPQQGDAREAYDKYMKDLDVATKDLADNGLMNPSARDNFRSLIRNNPLPALEIANESYQKALDLRTKDPNNVFVQTMPTFDDAFNGTLNNTYRNTDDVTRNAAIIGANIAKTITDDPEYNKILGGQYWQEIQRNGIPLNVFTAVQNGTPVNSDGTALNERDYALYTALGQALDNIKGQIGYEEFANNPDAQARLNGAIWNGLSTGLQTTKYDNIANKNFVDSISAAQNKRAGESHALEMWLAGADFDEDGNLTVDLDKAAERTSAIATAKGAGKGSGSGSGSKKEKVRQSTPIASTFVEGKFKKETSLSQGDATKESNTPMTKTGFIQKYMNDEKDVRELNFNNYGDVSFDYELNSDERKQFNKQKGETLSRNIAEDVRGFIRNHNLGTEEEAFENYEFVAVNNGTYSNPEIIIAAFPKPSPFEQAGPHTDEGTGLTPEELQILLKGMQ